MTAVMRAIWTMEAHFKRFRRNNINNDARDL